jgi:hypothetical protein
MVHYLHMMHYFSSWYSSPVISVFPGFLFFPALLIILALWSVAIKGYALWHAARNRQVYWFIAILVFNTAGILELVYLLGFCPGKPLSHLTSSHSREPKVSSES